MRFLDTNILLRYLTGDDPVKAAACRRLLGRVAQGQETVVTTASHIAEVCFVLTSKRLPYQLSPAEVRARLLPILQLAGVRMAEKQTVLRALDEYAARSIDFEDALAIATMQARHITDIISYDRDFDGIAGITRVEP